jgi:hypothetical protein
MNHAEDERINRLRIVTARPRPRTPTEAGTRCCYVPIDEWTIVAGRVVQIRLDVEVIAAADWDATPAPARPAGFARIEDGWAKVRGEVVDHGKVTSARFRGPA